MAATIGLVLDFAKPDRLASFWPAVLGHITLSFAGSSVLLVDESRQEPKLVLQRVPEPKTAKNRMQLEIETPTVDEEVARLERLGAQCLEAEACSEHGTRWAITADPEGTEFCVYDDGQPG